MNPSVARDGETSLGSPNFTDPPAARWHAKRRHEILAAHPDLAKLAGHNAWTVACVVGVVAVQLTLAFFLRQAPWYVVALVAYVIGSVLAHALGVLIHECAHNLVLASSAANKAVSIVANLPLVFPGAIDFRHKHLLHHKHLGEGELRDFQMPVARGAAWVGGSPLRKVLWIFVGALLFPRGHVDGTPTRPDGWAVANLVAVLATTLGVAIAFGPMALVYLALSGLFAFGAHPLGVRGFGEHFAARDGQPTSSYYGPLNAVSFNVGFHVEHHDFPAVPWNRLPVVTLLAAPHYEPLASVDSWGLLFLRYLFVPDVRLEDYVRRTHHAS